MNFSYMPQANPNEGINIIDRSFFIGVDLGQTTDYTAITILERLTRGRGVLGDRGEGEKSYHLRHIERPPRGTEYPDVVDRLIELYRSKPLEGVEKSVVIDMTGVGRPVYDLMRRSGFYYSLNAITITGGNDVVKAGKGMYNVPKRDLVTNLQVLLQNGSLKIAKGIKEADTLVGELTNFQTKITTSGHDVYGGRVGIHDDIVLSVAMAAWLAMNRWYMKGYDGNM